LGQIVDDSLFEVLDPRAGRRTRLTLDDLPPHFKEAVLAVEDANFYSHAGVDPTSTMVLTLPISVFLAVAKDKILSRISTSL
jgi:membrane peptidoglycan carboxypeptidase